MELKLLPLGVCRTPAFSYEQDLASVWDDLKAAIRESSRHFYKEIAHIEASQLNELPPKIKFTVWKYYNRSVYRATPFGSFASFTVVPVKNEGTYGSIRLQDQPIRHAFVDWSEKEKSGYRHLRSLSEAKKVVSNASFYEVGDSLRFLAEENDVFSLASVDNIPIVSAILEKCRLPVCIDELKNWLNKDFGLSKKQAGAMILQLVNLQLLFTDLQPNITGTDYFVRHGFSQDHPSKAYVLSESELLAGYFDHPALDELKEAILFLTAHLPSPPLPALEQFKEAFLKKFEYHEVPLSIALDPELGIGYANLEIKRDESTLMDEFNVSQQKNPENKTLEYGAWQRFILEGIIRKETIFLENFNNNNSSQITNTLPNTFSALVRCYGEELFIEEIGGCTANALPGRFTLASEQLEMFGFHIADLEKQSNPDVLFFDLAYQAELHAGNVNRRKSLYPYELMINTWQGETSPLFLNDLMVSVHQGEIFLRSAIHGKRIVPRFASAYNYLRSDLAVFRFLCDLQQQGLRTSLKADPAQFFPDLEFYPAVRFKNVLLSPARWRVPLIESLLSLRNWLNGQGIQYFKCGQGDQVLFFHTAIDDDLRIFMHYQKASGRPVYISKGKLPQKSMVVNVTGAPKMPEFILSFYHGSVVYKPSPGPIPQLCRAMNNPLTWRFPGSEWLYFELYCHPLASDQLLSQRLYPFIQQHQALLKNWFFIRYNEPAHHLRIRMQLKKNDTGYLIIQYLYSLLGNELQCGKVADLLVKPYTRETERYLSVPMASLEMLFSADSQYILRLLRKNTSVETRYMYGLALMQNVMSNSGYDTPGKLQFVKQVITQYDKEFMISLPTFRIINRSYKDFKKNYVLFIGSRKKAVEGLCGHYSSLLALSQKTGTANLLADLFHMHMNRLFTKDARFHELMLYHYLCHSLKEAAYAPPVSV